MHGSVADEDALRLAKILRAGHYDALTRLHAREDLHLVDAARAEPDGTPLGHLALHHVGGPAGAGFDEWTARHHHHPVARIEQHTVGLAHQLADGLRAKGLAVLTPAGNRSSIVAFRNPADAARTRAVLDAARARVSVRENGTQIRVSPALYNTAGDIRRFLEVVDALRKRPA